MVQVFLDFKNVDIADGQAVSVLLRSKFFEPEKQSRTWEIKCGKSTENNLLFREMIKQKKYTANAAVYADGVKIINGLARLIGWDVEGYSVCIIETGGNTDLLADATPIISFCRQYLENTGGYGLSDFIGHGSTIERGDMAGRWNTADYFFGGCMSIAELVGRLRQFDSNPDRWPADAWLQAQDKLNRNYLYGAKPIQLGGWSGDIVYHNGQPNKMPADVVTQYGRVERGNYANWDGINWLEFRGLEIYDNEPNAGFKISGNSDAVYIAGGETDSNLGGNNYAQGILCTHSESTVNIIGDGDFISTRPQVLFYVNLDNHSYSQVLQIKKLHWIVRYNGRGSIPTSFAYSFDNAKRCVDLFEAICSPIALNANDISFVAHTVQERAIEDNRSGQLYVETPTHVSEYGQKINTDVQPPEKVCPWSRGATEYDVFFSLGNLTIADLAAFCLHVLGLDLASQSTASALAGEINSVEPTTWSAEVSELTAQNDKQADSAVVSVVGADGTVFKRGNDNLKITVNINGGGNYNALWAQKVTGITVFPPSVEYTKKTYAGTTESAATAERMGDSEGVYIFAGNPDFPNLTLFIPPAYTPPSTETNNTETTVNISKGVRFTAKCRLNALELKKIKPNGQIHLQGTNISGMIESVEWSSNGETTIIFWQ